MEYGKHTISSSLLNSQLAGQASLELVEVEIDFWKTRSKLSNSSKLIFLSPSLSAEVKRTNLRTVTISLSILLPSNTGGMGWES